MGVPIVEKERIGVLCMILLGGIGVIFILLGIILSFRQKKKIKKCTSSVQGTVAEHRFPGEGKMFPVIKYQVDGYTVHRRYRGYITKKRVSPKAIYKDKGAYVTEKDYLYVPMSAITNRRAMAQELWPLESQMLIYYNPLCPKQAYAEKIPTKPPAETGIFLCTGIGILVLSAIAVFLIRL